MMKTTHNQDAQRLDAEALVTPGTMLAWAVPTPPDGDVSGGHHCNIHNN
jgi:hypothetical protein